MKKILLSAISISLLALAGCQSKPSNNGTSDKELNIIGKEVVLTYPTMTAKVKYLSEKQLHWQTTDKEGNVQEGTEDLSYKRIDGSKFFLNWIEEDGTTVSQILDLKAKNIDVYMSYTDSVKGRGGRTADFFSGKVELKK